MAGSPHHPVREDWLALTQEEVLRPDQPILDAHHHLWDRTEGRYVGEDFARDVDQGGHDVRASLYIQCRTGYRTDGPEALRPVGEVETVRAWCRTMPQYPIGIVAFADLQLGDGVRPVLDALVEAGEGRVRGVRNNTAHHPHPAVKSNAVPAPEGLMRAAAFREGVQALAGQGLVLDVWAYHTQLDEVCELARTVPGLRVVVDHCGGPLGVGPYQADRADTFRAWRQSLARIAELPNTWIKIGGFGLSVMGFPYARLAAPPDSRRLAADWAPAVDTCLALFGPSRSMFESNFPVDKGQFGYRTLWNAFKRLSAGLSDDERNDLFWRSAARCYGIDAQHFTSDQPRRHA
jgi:L-fuconolactonase